jgi:hypothetical protein
MLKLKVMDGNRSQPIPRTLSQAAGQVHRFRFKVVCVPYITWTWFRVAENVPVLRFNHAAREDVLPRMREVARSGFLTIGFLFDPRMNEGDQSCFGQFS